MAATLESLAAPSAGFLRGLRNRKGDPVSNARRRLLEVAHHGSLTLAGLGELEVLHSGDQHFERLLAAFETARIELSVEIYQVRRDAVGQRLLDGLARAAERGVRVRLLLDTFGSAPIVDWILAIRRRGVDARWYGSPNRWASPLRRTHRKLVVADGQVATLGGINFAAEFSEAIHGQRTWRDMAIWFRGAAAAVLRRQFEGAWQAEGGEPGGFLPVDATSDHLVGLAGGDDGRRGHAAAWHAMVACARHEVLLATPYFLPDRPFRARLVDAVARGVRVVVVIPRRSDIRWYMHAGRRAYDGLLRAGVEIWERDDRMVHAKVGVADGVVGAVGSANLNRRSFYGNGETLMVSTASELVEGIRSLIIDEAQPVAEVLHAPDWSRHPSRVRWAELLAAPMTVMF